MNISEKIKRKLFNSIGSVINGLSQNESKNTEGLDRTVTEGAPGLLRKVACEGTVLLRNDNVLPLSDGESVAVFGRTQYDYMYVGYGSGGDVIKPYTVNVIEGLESNGVSYDKSLANIYKEWCEKNPPDHGFWGHWPHYYIEMPIDDSVINEASEKSSCGIVIISRSAGEDRENSLCEGSYFLTPDEKSLIARVSSAFKKTVIILNVGSTIDMKWESECLKGDSAILLSWQGGMESGNAIAEMLYGKSEPSGRLPDTIARDYSDYPSAENFANKDFTTYTEDIYVGYRYFETFNKDAVIYPFGFGLGYAKFEREFVSGSFSDNKIALTVKTKNIHPTNSGKDVIQVYAECPQGKLGKPARVLCAYSKTSRLTPDSEEAVTLTFPINIFASYDDAGKTAFPSSYVLEKGEYKFYIGANVRDSEYCWSTEFSEDILVKKLRQVSKPLHSFKKLVPVATENGYKKAYEDVAVSTDDMKRIITDNLPRDFGYTGDKGIRLSDVKEGKASLEDFIAQLSTTELEAISRGDYVMNSPLGNKGNAGCMGGVLPSLRDKGISPLTTTDGPSGIRIGACCSLLPIGSLVSSMWNDDLATEAYALISKEMKVKGSDILLAPGMNIHRNPLCGRNFEYYSEDPVLTGKTAAAVVRGIQSSGGAACPKHFACNNQETNRNKSDSRLSERALREIYLKGFEICVKEAEPLTIMTSYNKINGVWGHYNYNLCTRILRQEWGFNGLVMTDWWMQSSKSPEFSNLSDNAYRVRAGVDVLMPGGNRTGKRKPDGTLLKTYKKPDGITLGEMQETAKHVIELVMKLK